MMPIAKILLGLMAAFAMLRVANYVVSVRRIIRFRLALHRPAVLAWEEIPEPVRASLAEGGAWAESHGFEVRLHQVAEPLLQGMSRVYSAHYLHENGHTILSIAPGAAADAVSWQAIFSSKAADGTWVLTLPKNGELLATRIAAVDAAFVEGDVDARFHTHRDREDAREFCVVQSMEQALEEIEGLRVRAYDAAVMAGELRRDQDGFRYTLRGAFRFAQRAFAEQRRMVKAAKLPGGASRQGPDAARLAAGWQEWRRMRKAPSGGRVGALVLFVVTLVLFMALGRIAFDTTFILLLTLVVMIHEGGHWLAMRLLGYTDTAIFFIPLFGAAATGRHARESAWREAIVLLAGPVPGVVLGTLMLLNVGGNYPPWAMQAAQIALFINLFNLLPIEPLDGGRLVNLAIFNHQPRLHSIFYVGGVVAFAWLAYRMGGTFMWVMVVLLALAIPARLRENRALSRVLAQRPLSQDEDSRAHLAIAAAVAVQPTMLPVHQYQLAEVLLRRASHAAAGLGERIAIFLAWVAAVGAPAFVFAGFLFLAAGNEDYMPREGNKPEAWIEWIHRKLPDQPQRVVEQAGVPVYIFVGDRNWDAVARILPEIDKALDAADVPAESRARALARVGDVLGRASPEDLRQKSWAYFDRALAGCDAAGDAACRGQVLALRGMLREDAGDRFGAIGDLDAAQRQPEPKGLSREISRREIREQLANLYADNGMPESAERVLMSGMGDAPSADDRLEIVARAARLRADHGDMPTALAMLADLRAMEPFSTTYGTAINVETAWLHLDAGDANAALAVLDDISSSDASVLLTKHIAGAIAKDPAIALPPLEILLKQQAAARARGDYAALREDAAKGLQVVGVWAAGAGARQDLMANTLEADAEAARASDPARAEAIEGLLSYRDD